MIIDILLEAVYILTVAVIWAMLVYQVILTFAGYLYSRRRRANTHIHAADLPFVSVMIDRDFSAGIKWNDLLMRGDSSTRCRCVVPADCFVSVSSNIPAKSGWRKSTLSNSMNEVADGDIR